MMVPGVLDSCRYAFEGALKGWAAIMLGIDCAEYADRVHEGVQLGVTGAGGPLRDAKAVGAISAV